MAENINTTKQECGEKVIIKKSSNNSGLAGAVYGLGLIGAAIFYISQAETFWMGVLGFLKAIVWPVFMVLHSFQFLYS